MSTVVKKPVAALARPLPAGRTVSASAFAFMFSELLNYHRQRTANLTEVASRYVFVS